MYWWVVVVVCYLCVMLPVIKHQLLVSNLLACCLCIQFTCPMLLLMAMYLYSCSPCTGELLMLAKAWWIDLWCHRYLCSISVWLLLLNWCLSGYPGRFPALVTRNWMNCLCSDDSFDLYWWWMDGWMPTSVGNPINKLSSIEWWCFIAFYYGWIC